MKTKLFQSAGLLKEFYILRPYGMGESFGTAWSTNGVKRSHYKKIIKQVVPVGLIL
jgi:hypothetical protein